MGVTAPLEAFKTETKGWGVRATGTIQEGEYICSYAGEVCTLRLPLPLPAVSLSAFLGFGHEMSALLSIVLAACIFVVI